MLKFYEAHKKQKALQKALKEDWQRSEPTLYPIQLSNNERAYLTAKFKKMTAGGGACMLFRIWLWRLYIFGYFIFRFRYYKCGV